MDPPTATEVLASAPTIEDEKAPITMSAHIMLAPNGLNWLEFLKERTR